MDAKEILKNNLEERNEAQSENIPRTVHAGSNDVSPKERVFVIRSVFGKIFRHLAVKDLKSIRFFCSTFNSVVLDIMGKPGCLFLEGNFYKDKQSISKMCYFNVTQKLTTLEWQLPDLNAMIKSSNRFPCRDFSFRRGSIKDPHLKEFFSLYGSRVRRLCLDVHFTEIGYFQNPSIYPTPEELFVILRAIPNVEQLELNYFPHTHTWDDGNVPENIQKKKKLPYATNSTSSNIFLSNLKILKLDNYTPDWFLESLVESSRKLKRVKIKQGGSYDYFVRTNKLHLLTNLHFEYMPQLGNDYKIISNHPNVSLSKLQVHTIGLYPFEPSVGQILSDLFQSNQNTLKSVTFYPLGNIPQLQIPELPEVLKLEIAHESDPKHEKFFPPKIDMCKIFPNIKYLKIRITPIANDRIFASSYKYFDFCPSPMPTVDTLCFAWDSTFSQMGRMYSSDFMDFFAKLCPRVTCAELRDIRSFNKDSRDFWKLFGKLKRLKISLHASEFFPYRSFFYEISVDTLHSIDTFFTGISSHNLKKALATWKLDGNENADQYRKIEKMRTHPSILLLKDLKQLEIIVYNNEQSEGFVPTLTDASRYFAFNYCPQLHVSFSLQLRNRSHIHEWKQVTKNLLS